MYGLLQSENTCRILRWNYYQGIVSHGSRLFQWIAGGREETDLTKPHQDCCVS